MAADRSHPSLSLNTIVIAIVAVTLIVGVGVASSRNNPSLLKTAQTIVGQCKAQQGDHATCYEQLVPALYPKLSVPQIFTIVRIIRDDDPQYQFCHVLAHKIGERVVVEDPSKWLDAIPYNPGDGLCSNGYIHGVIGGRFRAEVLTDEKIDELVPDFSKACEARPNWQPSDLDRAICYHGMGHLFDFISNANLPKALDVCSRTTTMQFRQVCDEGVFMQIYQPLEPDDFALIAQMPTKPSTTTVRTFCEQFSADPAYQGACLRESWPFFASDVIRGDVASFCGAQPNAEQENHCYDTVSAIVGRENLSSNERAAAACSNFPVERQATCYTAASQAVLEENRADASKALSLCQRAPAEIASQCIRGLIAHARFNFGSNMSEFKSFCDAVPSEDRATCMNIYNGVE